MYHKTEITGEYPSRINYRLKEQINFSKDHMEVEKLYLVLDAFEEALVIYKNHRIDFMNNKAIQLVNDLNCETVIDRITEELGNSFDDLKLGSGFMFYGFTKHVKELRIVTENKRQETMYMINIPIIIRDELCIMSFLNQRNPTAEIEPKEISTEDDDKDTSDSFGFLRSELVNILSHEMRTPLNIILGSLKLLSQNLSTDVPAADNPEKLNSYLSFIKSNSYRLLRLSNNFLDIINTDLGLEQLNLRNYDIVKIAKSIVKLSDKAADKKGIKILMASNVEKKLISVDRIKMERVLLNLISNAVKFSGHGGEIVLIILASEETVEISVIDEGIGIPPDKLDNIFKEFIQVDKSLSRNNEGAGIGLSLVKAFVELHKGTLRVKSNEGKGSCFTFSLPVGDLSKYEDGIDDSGLDSTNERIELEFSGI